MSTSRAPFCCEVRVRATLTTLLRGKFLAPQRNAPQRCRDKQPAVAYLRMLRDRTTGDTSLLEIAARDNDVDRDILRMAAAGNMGRAMRVLMKRHGRSVYRYCREALHDPTLADDVQQQVFIEAHRDLATFAGRSTVRTWLFAIARHRVLDAAKSRSRARAHIEEDATADATDPTPPPDERIDDATLTRALVACVASLNEPTRTAVLLRYQQGFTFEEMAVICDEKAGTLQARVMRALPQLKDCIEGRTGRT